VSKQQDLASNRSASGVTLIQRQARHSADYYDWRYDFWKLLKRCSVAAQRTGFVPCAAIIQFNKEALSYGDFTVAWRTAVE